ncbi:uncharacterized protein L201_005965 [Kwoniella dendrophila CBS 6074]|uniref:Transcription initiation factor TFIID subunit 10 n=1 Tax=Kwoniella dendrophila CBS 6074 TaxID=1295534 RepID=A0AAX4K2N8_9TREE
MSDQPMSNPSPAHAVAQAESSTSTSIPENTTSTSTESKIQTPIIPNETLPSTVNAEAGPSNSPKKAQQEDIVMENADNDQTSTTNVEIDNDNTSSHLVNNDKSTTEEDKQPNGVTEQIDEIQDEPKQGDKEKGKGKEQEKDTIDINMDTDKNEDIPERQPNKEKDEGEEAEEEEEEDTRPDLTELFAARREEELARRDRSLVEFLGMLDGYKPLIPEEVTEYYLQRSGFECSDPRLKRLLSLSAQKFISDLSRDAYHFAKLRVNGQNASGRGRPNTGVDRNRVVLTMEDLSLALSEHGVNVKKPDYYL